jgi:hypothetical protein
MAPSESQDLARALGVAAHPLRINLLYAFTTGFVRSPTEAALAIGNSIPNVRHHIAVLQREGFLIPTSAGKTSGGLDSRYEPTDRARVLVDALGSLA